VLWEIRWFEFIGEISGSHTVQVGAALSQTEERWLAPGNLEMPIARGHGPACVVELIVSFDQIGNRTHPHYVHRRSEDSVATLGIHDASFERSPFVFTRAGFGAGRSTAHHHCDCGQKDAPAHRKSLLVTESLQRLVHQKRNTRHSRSLRYDESDVMDKPN